MSTFNLESTISDEDENVDCEELEDPVVTVQKFGIQVLKNDGKVNWIPDVEYGLKPVLGMKFVSVDQAYRFYQDYGKIGGFDVKKGGEHNPKKVDPKLKYFHCVREGFKPVRKPKPEVKGDGKVDENVKVKTKRNRASIRCGCEAKLRIKRNRDGLYEVFVFEEEHNHYLLNEDDAKFLKVNRQLTYTQKNLLFQVSNINLGPVRGFKLMKEIYGGFEHIGATSVECKNFRRDMNVFIGERDCQMAVEKLKSKQEFNPGFAVEYFTSEDGTLGGLFWADPDARHFYSAFGDIVSFDSTFRSNRYSMVFVPFTGIDNHNRCVTFGSALLFNETYETYKWLLQKFKETFITDPNVLITDQDQSMKKAIDEVFPNSRHRLCMWHIMKKLSSKVGVRLSKDENFKKRLCSIVWTDKMDPEVFERKWGEIMKDYKLESHTWLASMFDLRFKWIPAYFRDEPMSGLMRTTSRSESENHFFGQLTNTHLTIVEFLCHYETAIDSQRFVYKKNQHNSRYTTPDLKTEMCIEKHAREVYTRTIFYDVQDDIYASLMHCYCLTRSVVNDCFKYQICDSEEENPNKIDLNHMPDEVQRGFVYEVCFNNAEMTVSCSCKKFESFGLLCKHCFCVFKIRKVDKIPEMYILKRWTKEALPPKINTIEGYGEKPNVAEATIREIYETVDHCINRLVFDMENLHLYRDKLKSLVGAVDSLEVSRSEMSNNELFSTMLAVTEPTEVNIKNPKDIRNKGCGSQTRYKSKAEIAQRNAEAKEKRKMLQEQRKKIQRKS